MESQPQPKILGWGTGWGRYKRAPKFHPGCSIPHPVFGEGGSEGVDDSSPNTMRCLRLSTRPWPARKTQRGGRVEHILNDEICLAGCGLV